MNSIKTLLVQVEPEQEGQTLAALLRFHLPGQSWRQVRQLIAARRVRVREELCLDAARRLKLGDSIEVLAHAERLRLPPEQLVTIRYVDAHVVVVEKPARMCTVRHPSERAWPEQRKALSPTLHDVVPLLLARQTPTQTRNTPEGLTKTKKKLKNSQSSTPKPNSKPNSKPKTARLRIVHRLDKETSGLVVFARSVTAERGLGKQFAAHTVIRRYLALVPGQVKPQKITSLLVRDRGDGRRGSVSAARDVQGQKVRQAITHVEVAEILPSHTLVHCRLETGRTHQIRIHLAELGHPVCGDRVYVHQADGTMFADRSSERGLSRLALHATELGFEHPVTGESLHWSMPLPADLQNFLDRLREEKHVGN